MKWNIKHEHLWNENSTTKSQPQFKSKARTMIHTIHIRIDTFIYFPFLYSLLFSSLILYPTLTHSLATLSNRRSCDCIAYIHGKFPIHCLKCKQFMLDAVVMVVVESLSLEECDSSNFGSFVLTGSVKTTRIMYSRYFLCLCLCFAHTESYLYKYLIWFLNSSSTQWKFHGKEKHTWKACRFVCAVNRSKYIL